MLSFFVAPEVRGEKGWAGPIKSQAPDVAHGRLANDVRVPSGATVEVIAACRNPPQPKIWRDGSPGPFFGNPGENPRRAAVVKGRKFQARLRRPATLPDQRPGAELPPTFTHRPVAGNVSLPKTWLAVRQYPRVSTDF